MRRDRIVILAALLLTAAPAAAQTANPKRVEFGPSPSHDVVVEVADPATGIITPVAVLGEYKFTINSFPSGALFKAGSLGKPAYVPVNTPDGTANVIRLTVPDLLTLPTGGAFTFSVIASGPGGDAAPFTSDSFKRVPDQAPVPAPAGKPVVTP